LSRAAQRSTGCFKYAKPIKPAPDPLTGLTNSQPTRQRIAASGQVREHIHISHPRDRFAD